VEATAKAPAANIARNGTKLGFTGFLHPFSQIQRTTGATPAASPRPVFGLLFECWPQTLGNQVRGDARPASCLPSLQTRAELARRYAVDVIVLCDVDDNAVTA
jgi:hypothetical protein